jgi:chromate reductase
MPNPKILVIPGSMQSRSYNARLAAVVAKELMLVDADVTRISLADYPLPLFDADTAAPPALPLQAVKLRRLVSAHHGVFIASPESNASIAPLLKNALDWISAVREPGELPHAAFQNRVFAIGGASPERSGTLQSLLALRQILAIGCGALVIAEQISVPNAEQAFDEMDVLRDSRAVGDLQMVVRKLVDTAAQFT